MQHQVQCWLAIWKPLHVVQTNNTTLDNFVLKAIIGSKLPDKTVYPILCGTSLLTKIF